MTDPEKLIARGRASLEGVTAAPWHLDGRKFVYALDEHGSNRWGLSVDAHNGYELSEAQSVARFIASARDLVPELCDALEATRREMDLPCPDCEAVQPCGHHQIHQKSVSGVDGNGMEQCADWCEVCDEQIGPIQQELAEAREEIARLREAADHFDRIFLRLPCDGGAAGDLGDGRFGVDPWGALQDFRLSFGLKPTVAAEEFAKCRGDIDQCSAEGSSND